MKMKIKAMSSESKASAYIVGSLPFIVFGMIWMINQPYMAQFFTDQRLTVIGLGALCWMGIGVFAMAKMVSFEILGRETGDGHELPDRPCSGST